MTAETSADAIFQSMNYFDEQAVYEAFKIDIADIADKRQMLFLRAMAFVDLRRKAPDHATAWTEAAQMTIEQLTDYFPDAPVELDPDDPDTPEGKEPALSE